MYKIHKMFLMKFGCCFFFNVDILQEYIIFFSTLGNNIHNLNKPKCLVKK